MRGRVGACRSGLNAGPGIENDLRGAGRFLPQTWAGNLWLSGLIEKVITHPETLVTRHKRGIPLAGNCAFCNNFVNRPPSRFSVAMALNRRKTCSHSRLILRADQQETA